MFKWIFITFLVALLAGSWRIVIRKAKPGGSDLAFTVIANLVGALTLFLFIPIFGLQIPNNYKTWIMLIVSGIVLSLSDYLLAYSAMHADTADASILTPLSNFFVLISAVVFLKENISTLKVFSTFLIVLGCIVTLYKDKKLVINRGIVAAFFYGIVITINFTIDKGISKNFSIPIYGGLIYTISASILTLLIRRNRLKTLISEVRLQKWVVITVGFIWGLYFLALLSAYSFGDASKVIPFMRISVIFVTIYSVFVLKETDRIKRKMVGAVIVTIGAILLAYA